MIPLVLNASSDAIAPFVTRLVRIRCEGKWDSYLFDKEGEHLWCGMNGLFEIEWPAAQLFGDVVLIDPIEGRAERLIRARSDHNTLLVTEQCDQLCTMCSQPPKKSHHDRFELFTKACLLAEPGATIGITGGEPTLHKAALLNMVETVLAQREDLSFHILSNGQHFTAGDVARLRDLRYGRVVWGIPLYSSDPVHHDSIVGKVGAFDRLIESFAYLLRAGARLELRTVLSRETFPQLTDLARFVVHQLPHIEQWSLMGLENIGFARNAWDRLYVDLGTEFEPVANALDTAALHGLVARVFNVPLCHIPANYRPFAVSSISDWKRRFGTACTSCTARDGCAGFFEWHPKNLLERVWPI